MPRRVETAPVCRSSRTRKGHANGTCNSGCGFVPWAEEDNMGRDPDAAYTKAVLGSVRPSLTWPVSPKSDAAKSCRRTQSDISRITWRAASSSHTGLFIPKHIDLSENVECQRDALGGYLATSSQARRRDSFCFPAKTHANTNGSRLTRRAHIHCCGCIRDIRQSANQNFLQGLENGGGSPPVVETFSVHSSPRSSHL